jgi:DNA repair protein RecN (Recombination protein N)
MYRQAFFMLQSLSISNFAIVKSVTVDFKSGLSVVTGETGAGKSIAIDGLSLCLGARADAASVRKGCSKAEVNAVFTLPASTNRKSQNTPQSMHLASYSAKEWLIEHELLLEEQPDEIHIRRVISCEGRSKAFINGRTVTLAQLKEVGGWLVSIHGQHAHHRLLKSDEQRNLLDAFAQHDELIDSVKTHYLDYHKIQQQLTELTKAQQQRKDRAQLLSYQVQELDEFALAEHEFQELESEHKRLSHSQTLLESAQLSFHRLYDDEQGNALSTVQKSLHDLQELVEHDASLAPIITCLNEATVNIEEASNELRVYCDDLDIDPLRITQVEARYTQAMELARKHAVSPEQLYQTHLTLSQELASLQSDEDSLAHLQEEVSLLAEKYKDAAYLLSASRQKHGQVLAEQIQKSIANMNMPHAKLAFSVTFNEAAPFSGDGQDDISIQVTTNPGQPMGNIEDVVSGGELSRIGLAIQVITSDINQVPTLIFDEVDTGISGPTASIVGSLLRQLGKHCQVLCVTHLPQVAAQGHQQLFVSKLTDGDTTETTMRELTQDSRVNELARLLAGDELTDSAIANAQDLLKKVS